MTKPTDKQTTIPVPKNVRDSIENIIDSVYHREREHFVSASPEVRSDHIFTRIDCIYGWLWKGGKTDPCETITVELRADVDWIIATFISDVEETYAACATEESKLEDHVFSDYGRVKDWLLQTEPEELAS